MTPSEHAALSAELARALGYFSESIKQQDEQCCVFRHSVTMQKLGWSYPIEMWHVFDYRDPTVCLPLIEWLGTRNITIYFDFMGAQVSIRLAGIEPFWVEAPTIEECVARAVIAVKGKT